ncbi:nuclear speckle splicing regulatory protein 1 isoform X1 [Hemicordylus capensis]|uniref:nuclear speckle splicing regulatory protein 1 isoform X1 n=2 Tax=Hemicordylus capensis TaxID=884348 RepID=UPI002304CE3F|nr:nuclear speckle splicing regulatory protein 1 isoform X1 [Hemicordylus capensis]
MAAPSKQYGLIFPKKAQQKTFVKHSVFMDDSDEESSVSESLQREALKKQAMKQTKLEIQRALAEDSTVYEYDNIYDDIQQKKAESQASALMEKGEKKPKYIQHILKAAELRKKEQEKRMEKKIQKEREMEGGAFDDKEAFVTSAYKKKLQERAEEEERERQEAALEACLDVTKQKDLSGFYRHLLNQAVGEEEVPKCSLREARIKEEKPSGDSQESRQTSQSPEERARPHVPAKGEDNPDADSDLEVDSSDDSSARGHMESRAGDKKETRQGTVDSSGEGCRPGKSRRDSRSSSEERSCHSKVPAGHLGREEDGGGKKERSGQRKERDRERRHTDLEREECARSEDHPKRREEHDSKQRRKDRKARDDHDRHLRREREREKSPEREQPGKERPRNSHDRYRDRDRGDKEKGARQAKAQEGERGDLEASLSLSEQPPELKRKAAGGEAEQPGAPLESRSKFAKRSNQEMVTSARDRYLARQLARVSTKPYIEKEED